MSVLSNVFIHDGIARLLDPSASGICWSFYDPLDI